MAGESRLQTKILNYLRSLQHCFCFKIEKASDNGVPDIFFVIDGKCCFLEVKDDGKKPAKHQLIMMAKLRNAGVAATWCDSWEIFYSEFQNLRHGWNLRILEVT